MPDPTIRAPWTGPLDGDLWLDGTAKNPPLPPERWPYGAPAYHEECCDLFAKGRFCDCSASAADDEEWGEGHAGTGRIVR